MLALGSPDPPPSESLKAPAPLPLSLPASPRASSLSASMFLGVSCTSRCVPTHFFPCLSMSVSPSQSPSSLQSSHCLSPGLYVSVFPSCRAQWGGVGGLLITLLCFCPESRKGEGLTLRGSYLLELLLIGPLMGMRSRGLAGR